MSAKGVVPLAFLLSCAVAFLVAKTGREWIIPVFGLGWLFAIVWWGLL
jgi:hypothetical protein